MAYCSYYSSMHSATACGEIQSLLGIACKSLVMVAKVWLDNLGERFSEQLIQVKLGATLCAGFVTRLTRSCTAICQSAFFDTATRGAKVRDVQIEHIAK